MALKRSLLAIVASTGFSTSVLAQDADPAPAPPAPPSCTDPVHTQFDFWVGEWNVYDQQGNYGGHNTIEKEFNGCMIRESWEGSNGIRGESYNYYDPLAESWRQVWHGLGIYIDYAGGLNEEGSMVLDGEIFYHANGNRADFRGTWTLLDDGAVRQLFEQRNADGEWQTWFDGRYVRKEDDPNAERAEEIRQAAGQ